MVQYATEDLEVCDKIKRKLQNYMRRKHSDLNIIIESGSYGVLIKIPDTDSLKYEVVESIYKVIKEHCGYTQKGNKNSNFDIHKKDKTHRVKISYYYDALTKVVGFYIIPEYRRS